jgi:hypothetical protein
MLPQILRMLLLRRLFGGGRGRHRGYGYGHAPRRRGYGYAPRRRGGFGMTGPFPTYSRRTRGGGRVSVGGCCLPIPLALALTTAGVGRVLVRR